MRLTRCLLRYRGLDGGIVWFVPLFPAFIPSRPYREALIVFFKLVEKDLRRPGIEPGSTAWKAAMLTTIPPTLWLLEALMKDPLLVTQRSERVKCQKCRDQDSNLGYCGHNAGS